MTFNGSQVVTNVRKLYFPFSKTMQPKLRYTVFILILTVLHNLLVKVVTCFIKLDA